MNKVWVILAKISKYAVEDIITHPIACPKLLIAKHRTLHKVVLHQVVAPFLPESLPIWCTPHMRTSHTRLVLKLIVSNCSEDHGIVGHHVFIFFITRLSNLIQQPLHWMIEGEEMCNEWEMRMIRLCVNEIEQWSLFMVILHTSMIRGQWHVSSNFNKFVGEF